MKIIPINIYSSQIPSAKGEISFGQNPALGNDALIFYKERSNNPYCPNPDTNILKNPVVSLEGNAFDSVYKRIRICAKYVKTAQILDVYIDFVSGEFYSFGNKNTYKNENKSFGQEVGEIKEIMNILTDHTNKAREIIESYNQLPPVKQEKGPFLFIPRKKIPAKPPDTKPACVPAPNDVQNYISWSNRTNRLLEEHLLKNFDNLIKNPLESNDPSKWLNALRLTSLIKVFDEKKMNFIFIKALSVINKENDPQMLIYAVNTITDYCFYAKNEHVDLKSLAKLLDNQDCNLVAQTALLMLNPNFMKHQGKKIQDYPEILTKIIQITQTHPDNDAGNLLRFLLAQNKVIEKTQELARQAISSAREYTGQNDLERMALLKEFNLEGK